jgi:predicted ATP-grasp superfamily ATP-dependent carboligase
MSRTTTTAARGSAFALLAQARAVLTDAAQSAEPGERFRLAHLSALRAAAAVSAERGRPASARRRLMNVWVLLERVAPEHAEWARYFAAGAPLRAAVEAGAVSAVSARTADDQLRSAAEFLALVEDSLGLLAA